MAPTTTERKAKASEQAQAQTGQESANGATPSPPEGWEGWGLVRRVAWVQASMPTPQKRGHAHVETKSGGSYDYDYVTEPDMMHVVRRWCGVVGVAIFPSAPLIQRVENLVTANMDFVLACEVKRGEEVIQEERQVSWTADGTDYGDKAVNKAYTTCMRYFMQKQFLIETDGIDPEQENQERERPTGGGQQRQRTGGRKVNDKQVKLIRTRARVSGVAEVDLDTVIELWSQGAMHKPEDVTMDTLDSLLEVFAWFKDNPERGRKRIADYREAGGAEGAPEPEPTEFDPTREGGDPDAPPAGEIGTGSAEDVLCSNCGVAVVENPGDVCAECRDMMGGEEYGS